MPRKYKTTIEGTLVPSFSLLIMGFEGIEQKVAEKVESILSSDEELFLVSVEIKGHTGNQKLVVGIDGDNGLPIDKCANVSRALGAWIEEEDLMDGKYILEVTSPGADQPLKMKRQYRKHVGRKLQVEKVDGSVVVGQLLSLAEDMVNVGIEENKQLVESSIPFDEISSSNVIISFK